MMNTLLKSAGNIRLSINEANHFLSLYHGLFPEISSWHRDVQQQLKSTRTLRNFFGYPRYFTGRWDDKLFKEAYAFIPQSTVGCITAIAITEAQSRLRPTWDILQDGHDAILGQCPVGEEREMAALFKECLGMSLTSHRGEKLAMSSEAKAGFNWYEMEDIKQ